MEQQEQGPSSLAVVAAVPQQQQPRERKGNAWHMVMDAEVALALQPQMQQHEQSVDGSSTNAWSATCLLKDLRMTATSVCHYYRGKNAAASSSPAAELGVFCVLTTYRTQKDVFEKLKPFGCISVEQMQTKDFKKHAKFVEMTNSKCMVFELGFQAEQFPREKKTSAKKHQPARCNKGQVGGSGGGDARVVAMTMQQQQHKQEKSLNFQVDECHASSSSSSSSSSSPPTSPQRGRRQQEELNDDEEEQRPHHIQALRAMIADENEQREDNRVVAEMGMRGPSLSSCRTSAMNTPLGFGDDDENSRMSAFSSGSNKNSSAAPAAGDVARKLQEAEEKIEGLRKLSRCVTIHG